VSLVITPDGNCECLHNEAIELHSLGTLRISRATEIEFDDAYQEWIVRDNGGRRLHSHVSREECLQWERRHMDWLQDMKHGGVT
jgi:hypothetical protein